MPNGRARGPVLVVDDESSVRTLMAVVLQNRGHEVLTAESGEEAVVLLDREACRPDLVVLDLHLDGMTGTETLAVLRGIHPKLRALFVSGAREDDPTLDEETAPAACAFLAKPFSASDLESTVEALLTA